MFYKKESGFTLMEVLVALTLMGLTLTAVVQLFSGSLRTVSKSQDYIYAFIRADAAMREVMERRELDVDSWTETDMDGNIIDVVVSEVEEDRFEELEEHKLLQIDLTFKWIKGESERVIKLSSMRVVYIE